jgi:hypothetical protein
MDIEQHGDSATASEEGELGRIVAVARRMTEGGRGSWWVAHYRLEEDGRPGEVVPVDGQFFSAVGALSAALEEAKLQLLKASFVSQRSRPEVRRYS